MVRRRQLCFHIIEQQRRGFSGDPQPAQPEPHAAAALEKLFLHRFGQFSAKLPAEYSTANEPRWWHWPVSEEYEQYGHRNNRWASLAKYKLQTISDIGTGGKCWRCPVECGVSVLPLQQNQFEHHRQRVPGPHRARAYFHRKRPVLTACTPS